MIIVNTKNGSAFLPKILDLYCKGKMLPIKSSRTHIPTAVGILTGLRPNDDRVSLDSIAEQVEATRQRDFAVFSFFFSGSLFDLGLAADTPTTREDAFASLLSTDQFV